MTLQPHNFYYDARNRTLTYWHGSIQEPGRDLILMIAYTSQGDERSLWLNKLN